MNSQQKKKKKKKKNPYTNHKFILLYNFFLLSLLPILSILFLYKNFLTGMNSQQKTGPHMRTRN